MNADSILSSVHCLSHLDDFGEFSKKRRRSADKEKVSLVEDRCYCILSGL